MPIREKDIKLLWGRSGGRCAFPDCRRKLSEDKQSANDSIPIGEQAHIVAEERGGPRGNSILTVEERNSYPNLMLLCPTHHTIIDKAPEDYPVEKLHQIKREHELHIEHTTSDAVDLRAQAHQLVYASLIDSATEAADFENWQAWTSWVLSVNPRWRRDAVDQIGSFRQRIIAANWPGTLEELERALTTLSMLLYDAIQEFLEHVTVREDCWVAERFYKDREYDEGTYLRLLRDYEQWTSRVDKLILAATKAANWVADVVRRDVNPLFFAVEGRFLVTYPDGLGTRTSLLQYSEEERSALPGSLSRT